MNQENGIGETREDRLLGDFPAPGKDQWRQEVDRLLKGASFEKRLITTTVDGLTIRPFYTRSDAEGLEPALRPECRWEVAQELPVGDPGEFNRLLRCDLERGQTAVNLDLEKTPINSLEDLTRALAGVDLERIPLFLRTAPGTPDLSGLLRDLCRERGTGTGALAGSLGFDPLAPPNGLGEGPDGHHRAREDQARVVRWSAESAPGMRGVVIDGAAWHDAGAGATQELAFAMASAIAALRALEALGVDTERAAGNCWFRFAVGTDFFGEVAKFRAARRLWARIVEACGGGSEAAKLVFHARSSGWSSTLFDPQTNILRSTTEAFAAIAGGCASLHLAPFDERTGSSGELARRLARNTQLILRDEARFDQVADPAGGSWYVESLTEQLARRAWELLQEIESSGGMARAVQNGYPQQLAATTAAKRRKRLASRKDVLVGTNRYPLAGETPSSSVADSSTVLRGGSPFEALRTRVVKAGPPKVLPAAMGPPGGYMARLEFIRSFYQVGGFEVPECGGFDSAAEVLEAVAEHRPAAVCIVSRDERYAGLVPGLAAELRAAHADLVLHLAGGGTEALEQFGGAGVTRQVTLHTDILELLSELADQAGVN